MTVDVSSAVLWGRSTYENMTDSVQDHSFQTERTTVSCCTTAVSKGFTKGVHLEVPHTRSFLRHASLAPTYPPGGAGGDRDPGGGGGGGNYT